MDMYRVMIGVYGATNPGLHAIAMISRLGDQKDEWAKAVGSCTTPRAWIMAVRYAFDRVYRPQADVQIFIRDRILIDTLKWVEVNHPAYEIAKELRSRSNTKLLWEPKKNDHPDMNRAYELAKTLIR